MIADGEIADPLAQRLDDSRSLMSKRHRDGARTRTVDHRKVGVAKPGCLDPDEEFAAAGRGEIEFDDVERPGRGVGRGEADLGEDGGFDAHGRSTSRHENAMVSHTTGHLSCPWKRASRDRRARVLLCFSEGSTRWLWIPAQSGDDNKGSRAPGPPASHLRSLGAPAT